jgi:hypothetical protein
MLNAQSVKMEYETYSNTIFDIRCMSAFLPADHKIQLSLKFSSAPANILILNPYL